MIRLFTTGTRVALVAVAMALSISAITLAQAAEPATESEPAVGPVQDASGPEDDPAVQTDPFARATVPAAVEVEIQRRDNELRSERLDDREASLNRWLWGIGIFITIAVSYVIYIVSKSQNRAKTDQLIGGVNAQRAAEDPEEAKRTVKNVQNNLEASVIDKAIARAVSLQQQGSSDDAIKQWRAVALIAEESDHDLAGRAWFSIGYLLQDKDPEGGVSAYDQVLRLTPATAAAYTNRGVAKAALKRYDEAIADYNKALDLKPDYAEAYANRGSTKAALERYDDAIADYNKALDLDPDYAGTYYNRGLSEAALGLESEAMKDFEIGLELARKANDSDLIGHVERVLRNRHTAGNS